MVLMSLQDILADKYYKRYQLTTDSISLNYEIKFIQKKPIYFSNDGWLHTFKIDMPTKHVFKDINICSKDLAFPVQTGCSIGQEIIL